MSRPGLSPVAGRRFMPDLEPCPACGREPTTGQNYCKVCKRLYTRAYREWAPHAREYDRARMRARYRATERLIALYREEWTKLFAEEQVRQGEKKNG